MGVQVFSPRMRTARFLAVVPILVGCPALLAQGSTPILTVTGSGSTSWGFSGSYYGGWGSTPFVLDAAHSTVPGSNNFIVSGSFGSTSATIHMLGNVVFGKTYFNGCPYGLCTWTYGAGATLNISLQGTAGTKYTIDITRTASLSASTVDPLGAYSASAESTSADTQRGPTTANLSTSSTIQGTGSINTVISMGAGLGFRQTWCVADSQGCTGYTPPYPGGGAGTVDYSLTIVVRGSSTPPSITCPTPTASTDLNYSSGFGGSGGTTPYTFSLASGGLPPGLILDSSSGAITGLPTVDGTFNFTGLIQDASNQSATASCSIAIGGGQCSQQPAAATKIKLTSSSSGQSCTQIGQPDTNGCSIPQTVLTALCADLRLKDKDAYNAAHCSDPNNPAGGKYTLFSTYPSKGSFLSNGACDLHDYCYDTCSATDTGTTFLSHKKSCDDTLRYQLQAVCAAAASQGDPPAVIRGCQFFASAYATGVWLFGLDAYIEAQHESCLCCPSGGTDGSFSTAGGTVTDDLFGDRAQVTAPNGALTTYTAVSIDVLPASLNAIVPQGFNPATYFTTIALTPHPTLLPYPGATVVLPLVTDLVPGAKVVLYQVDASKTLVPEMSSAGGSVSGSVDSATATVRFTGVGSFSTVVGLYMPGDLNGDLKVDCSDITIVKAAYGKNATQTGFDSRADVNFDGVVDIRDLSLVSQRLPAGTRCQ